MNNSKSPTPPSSAATVLNYRHNIQPDFGISPESPESPTHLKRGRKSLFKRGSQNFHGAEKSAGRTRRRQSVYLEQAVGRNNRVGEQKPLDRSPAAKKRLSGP
jgi:hypothetical protein